MISILLCGNCVLQEPEESFLTFSTSIFRGYTLLSYRYCLNPFQTKKSGGGGVEKHILSLWTSKQPLAVYFLAVTRNVYPMAILEILSQICGSLYWRLVHCKKTYKGIHVEMHWSLNRLPQSWCSWWYIKTQNVYDSP